jgi:hypothetical protein
LEITLVRVARRRGLTHEEIIKVLGSEIEDKYPQNEFFEVVWAGGGPNDIRFKVDLLFDPEKLLGIALSLDVPSFFQTSNDESQDSEGLG